MKKIGTTGILASFSLVLVLSLSGLVGSAESPSASDGSLQMLSLSEKEEFQEYQKWRQQADQGDSEAMLKVGRWLALHPIAIQVPDRLDEAFFYLKKSAEKGNVLAMRSLWQIAMKKKVWASECVRPFGRTSMFFDDEYVSSLDAEEWLRKAAEARDDISMVRLSLHLEEAERRKLGRIVEIDGWRSPEARGLMVSAYMNGSGAASIELARHELKKQNNVIRSFEDQRGVSNLELVRRELEKQDSLDSALRYSDIALQLGQQEGAYLMASILASPQGGKRYGAAQVMLEKAVLMQEDDDTTKTVSENTLLYALGMVNELRGSPEDALEFYRKAVVRDLEYYGKTLEGDLSPHWKFSYRIVKILSRSKDASKHAEEIALHQKAAFEFLIAIYGPWVHPDSEGLEDSEMVEKIEVFLQNRERQGNCWRYGGFPLLVPNLDYEMQQK